MEVDMWLFQGSKDDAKVGIVYFLSASSFCSDSFSAALSFLLFLIFKIRITKAKTKVMMLAMVTWRLFL